MALNRLGKLRILVVALLCFAIINIVIRLHNNTEVHEAVKKHWNRMSLSHLIPAHPDERQPDGEIDWEDHDFVHYELTRIGLGEQGQAVTITDSDEIKLNEDWLKKEGFYVNVSNKISVTRSLGDLRPEICRKKKYHQNLPIVSVVIVFYNEMTSTLLRCVHSVYNRTPKKLLHEIILVNDNSSFSVLFGELHYYVEQMFDGRVKIHENKEREGLIKARMTGAKIATGEVLVFLDSHMEVYNTWLPPLLDVLVDHPDAGAVPITDGMDAKTFKPTHVGYGHRGVFDWNLRYQWLPLRPEDTKVPGAPYELACLTGGAYAIRREHFFHLGGYDEGLMIWNGENYELCLKLWLCSGGLYQVPCARVTHLSKHFSAYRRAATNIDYVARNLKRVAEVWLDEYKEKLYDGDRKRYEKAEVGDLTKQFAKKESLNCKPFKYFLERVAPDMLVRFPVENIYFAQGKIENLGSIEGHAKCFGLTNRDYSKEVSLVDCDEKNRGAFTLTLEKSIRYNDTNDQCFKANGLSFGNCHHMGYDQYWKFDLNTRRIFSNDKKKCLQGDMLTSKISLENCDEKSKIQMWKWASENVTALNNFDSTGVVYDKK